MVKFLDLRKVTESHGEEIMEAVRRVTESGWYLQGAENARFEQDYAAFIGTRHAIGCGNGLDALIWIFRAYIEMGVMRPGDEVIVPANTYIASILAISDCGLVPVLAEPDEHTCQIDAAAIRRALTERTRAVMIVHLYGICAYTEEIGEICREAGIKLVEDNAQAHGCRYAGRRTGSLGDAAGHSFYPGKNLGALGDGGAVTTDDEELARTVRMLANYGSERKYVFRYRGRNSRLDEIQAAVLSAKLPHLDEDNDRRRRIADIYRTRISHPGIYMPQAPGDNVYHIFPIFTDSRDSLQRHLADCGIETLIHYPVPPHRQQCYPELHGLSLPVSERMHARELSLPISPVMTETEAEIVAEAVNSYQ